MSRIPSGYRELEPGEIIKREDKISRKGIEPFKTIKETAKYIGAYYKAKETPLFQETVLIRKEELKKIEEVNILCDISSQNVYDIFKQLTEHPVFGRYNQDNANPYYKPCYLYILTNFQGRNLIGTYDSTKSTSFAKCKQVTYDEFLMILNPPDWTDPKYKRVIEHKITMDINISPEGANSEFFVKA